MIVGQVLDVINGNVNVYVQDILTGELITYSDGKNRISASVLCDTVESINTTNNGKGIVLEICYNVVDFDDLCGEAKLNCLSDYIYRVCPYEHFEDLSLTELEDCAREFWLNGGYTVDKYGNWYDEDFQKI